MNNSEIIKQAKHYFGKDKSYIKELVLSYEFNGKHYKQWKKDLSEIIPNPNEVKFKLFEDVILWIKDNKLKEINWNFIGDISWTIDIVLNPNINKGYDWDKKLALKCNGTARILTLFISDIIPCYTYDCYYMTYNKLDNYYEFGPLFSLTKEEKNLLKKVTTLLQHKGLKMIDKKITQKKYKALYSDTNSDGNATLFDVLFTDVNNYTTDITRFSSKSIIEKNGQKLSWREYYHKNGTLKERIEHRLTSSGDQLKIVLDNKRQITLVEVTRKKIGRNKYENFKLDILKTYEKRKRNNDKKKKSN